MKTQIFVLFTFWTMSACTPIEVNESSPKGDFSAYYEHYHQIQMYDESNVEPYVVSDSITEFSQTLNIP